ncbi:MAG: DNA-3-methyladenine glycosylase 2 family protein, partial [Acidimicrobiia bacterium]|nr:DNA-3-methyladenine glycosylase 2 family protein [Acidimicrobiia bacterium]
DEGSFGTAVEHLASVDDDLGAVIREFGDPPFWNREPGFGTLVWFILEQQVSLASAKATFDRLVAAIGPPEPGRLLDLDDDALLEIGFSRQKRAYARGLAEAILSGDFSPESLETLDDAAVTTEMTRLKGIGPWTAHVYLLMVLRRPDVWPAGDIALATAVKEVKGLDERPDPASLEAIGESWRPWRSVAARILWHHYLAIRGRS